MTTDTTTYNIEISREEIKGDPPISIFRTVTLRDSGRRKAEWREAFGSVEQLNAYLQGMRTILMQEGFDAIRLHWCINAQWNDPIGLQFTIDRNGCVVSELRRGGSAKRV